MKSPKKLLADLPWYWFLLKVCFVCVFVVVIVVIVIIVVIVVNRL